MVDIENRAAGGCSGGGENDRGLESKVQLVLRIPSSKGVSGWAYYKMHLVTAVKFEPLRVS